MEQADLIRGEITPEEAGINSRDVLECIRALDETENEVHGFVAARHGRIFAESYLAPYAKDIPHTCHSLGKSYTCTAVGIACTEGLLSPEDKVVDLFAGEIAAFGIESDDNMSKIKLCDVMSMSSGMERMPDLNETWLENYLKSPVRYTPGTQFLYNSVGSCLLGAAVEKATGKRHYRITDKKLCLCCKHYGQCTESKNGRKVTRLYNEDAKQRFEAQYLESDSQAIYAKRKTRAEHPFGHIKRNIKTDAFMLRGRDGVQAETSLLATCFNVVRMITIFGVSKMREYMEAFNIVPTSA